MAAERQSRMAARRLCGHRETPLSVCTQLVDGRLQDPRGEARTAGEVRAPGGAEKYADRVASGCIGEEAGKHGPTETLRRMPVDPEARGDVEGVHQRFIDAQ